MTEAALVYTCEACGETFGSDIGRHDEATEEYKQEFGREPDPSRDAIICHDCYMKCIENEANLKYKS